MPGKFTILFSSPHFTRREEMSWRALQTYANCERAVKTHLDKVGVENYLPTVSVRPADGGRPRRELQLANVIFARYDCRQYPGLCTGRNKLYPEAPRAGLVEQSVIDAMESCWRLETLSAKYPVEKVSLKSPPGTPCQLKGGPLSGSCGYHAVEDGRPVFYLPLPEEGLFARIHLTAETSAARQPMPA